MAASPADVFRQAAGGGTDERLPSFEAGRQLELPHAEALIGRLEQDALLDGEQHCPIRVRASSRASRDSGR